MNQPISQSTGFKPFKNAGKKRPVALPQPPAVKPPQGNAKAPPASPHMARHMPQVQPKKLEIPDRTPEAPFGYDEHGKPLTVTEFANRRLAQQDPSLPQVHVPQQPQPQSQPASVVRKYGEPVPLDLPSGYVFYGQQFNALYVRPIRGHNMSLFASAWANRSKRQEVLAVSSVLEVDTQLPNPVGYYLTLGDYYWLLYRLRFTNYSRPIKHTDLCQSDKHQKEVREGRVPRKSLLIETPLSEGMMEEKTLSIMPQYDQELMFNEELGYPIKLRPATMLDMIETLEHDNFGKDAQWDYLSQLACYVEAPTYAARMEIARALTPDQIEHMQSYERILSSYGMIERIRVKCSHCGHEQEAKVTIDASTFLPG